MQTHKQPCTFATLSSQKKQKQKNYKGRRAKMKWNLMIFKTSKCTHNISFLYSFHVCPQTAHALREKFTESHALTILSLSHPQLQPHQSARVFSRLALLFHIQLPPLYHGFLRQWLFLMVLVFFQVCRMPHSLPLRLLDSIQGLQLCQFPSTSYCR